MSEKELKQKVSKCEEKPRLASKMAQMAWTSNSLQCNAPFVVAFAWQVKREKPQGKTAEEKCITKSSSLRYDFDKCNANREPHLFMHNL